MDKNNALRGDAPPLGETDVLLELVTTQRQLIKEQRLMLSLLTEGCDVVGVGAVVEEPEDGGEGVAI